MPVRLLRPIIAATLIAAPVSRAAIVALDNSSVFTVPPADNFGFGNVGTVFNSIAGFPCSGVYIGDGWMISAYHNVANGAGGFAFGGITLGGLGYTADAVTATRLHNPDTTFADLAIFRLTTIPAGLSSVNLSGIVAPLNAPVKMAGNGQNRLATETRWQVSGSTWTEVTTGWNAVGYKLDPLGSRGLRWGNNNIETSPAPLGDGGFGPIFAAFRMDFGDSSLSAPSGEAQATPGDSGGGVFWKNGGNWELSGIVISTFPYANQPAGTSVYGNQTAAASIATYKAEIESTMLSVPEPAASTLLLAGAGLLARRRRTGTRVNR